MAVGARALRHLALAWATVALHAEVPVPLLQAQEPERARAEVVP